LRALPKAFLEITDDDFKQAVTLAFNQAKADWTSMLGNYNSGGPLDVTVGPSMYKKK
jgi:hypothetical protein